jgi:hypothetical protein
VWTTAAALRMNGQGSGTARGHPRRRCCALMTKAAVLHDTWMAKAAAWHVDGQGGSAAHGRPRLCVDGQISNPNMFPHHSFFCFGDNIPPQFRILFHFVSFLILGRSSRNGELPIVPRSLFLRVRPLFTPKQLFILQFMIFGIPEAE